MMYDGVLFSGLPFADDLAPCCIGEFVPVPHHCRWRLGGG